MGLKGRVGIGVWAPLFAIVAHRSNAGVGWADPLLIAALRIFVILQTVCDELDGDPYRPPLRLTRPGRDSGTAASSATAKIIYDSTENMSAASFDVQVQLRRCEWRLYPCGLHFPLAEGCHATKMPKKKAILWTLNFVSKKVE